MDKEIKNILRINTHFKWILGHIRRKIVERYKNRCLEIYTLKNEIRS